MADTSSGNIQRSWPFSGNSKTVQDFLKELGYSAQDTAADQDTTADQNITVDQDDTAIKLFRSHPKRTAERVDEAPASIYFAPTDKGDVARFSIVAVTRYTAFRLAGNEDKWNVSFEKNPARLVLTLRDMDFPEAMLTDKTSSKATSNAPCSRGKPPKSPQIILNEYHFVLGKDTDSSDSELRKAFPSKFPLWPFTLYPMKNSGGTVFAAWAPSPQTFSSDESDKGGTSHTGYGGTYDAPEIDQ